MVGFVFIGLKTVGKGENTFIYEQTILFCCLQQILI